MRIRLSTQIGFLAFMATALSGSHRAVAKETDHLSFAYLDYEPGTDALVRTLISELNAALHRSDKTSGVAIAADPQRLTYYQVGRALSRRPPEILFLSAMVFTDLISTPQGRDYEAIRVQRSTSQGNDLSTTYVGEVLINPTTVNPDTLNRAKGAEKDQLTCARLRSSASGNLFFLDTIAHYWANQLNGERQVGQDLLQAVQKTGIAGIYRAVTARSHMDCLRMFFSTRSPVDIAPVWEGAVAPFLDSPVEGSTSLLGWELVRQWAIRCAPDARVGSAREAQDLINARCLWKPHGFLKTTSRIPEDIFAATTRLPPAVRNVLASVLDQVDVDMFQLDEWFKGRGGCPRDETELRRSVQEFAGTHVVKTSLETLAAIAALHRHGWGPVPTPALDEVRSLAEVYREARQWEELPVDRGNASALDVIADISEDIGYHRRLDPAYHPRIAVVLSGGGASGCYQAGAVRAFFGALAGFNAKRALLDQEGPETTPLAVSIAAGTSVGAINVVASLLAVPSGAAQVPSNGTTDPLRDMWSRINGARILVAKNGETLFPFESSVLRRLRTWPLLAVVVVVCIAGIMTLYTFSLLRPVGMLTAVRRTEIWPFTSALAMAVLVAFAPLRLLTVVAAIGGLAGIIGIWWGRRPISRMALWIWPLSGSLMLLSLLFRSVEVERAIVWGVASTIIPLLVFAAGADDEAKHAHESPPGGAWHRTALRAGWCCALIVVFAGPVWMLDLLINREAVFSSSGLKRVLVEELARVAPGRKEPPEGDEDSSVAAVSRAVAAGLPGDMDIVLTATELARTPGRSMRPREVYFYRRARADSAAGRRMMAQDIPAVGSPGSGSDEDVVWSDIDGQEEKLIDMLVASASIFPGLPPHMVSIQVNDPYGGGETRNARLIDGGFLHQIPIEAAVRLGATHVVVFKLQPEEVGTSGSESEASAGDRHGLARDLGDVFNLLLERAQAGDWNAGAGVTVYSLAPRERWVGTFDFDGGKRAGETAGVSLGDFYDIGYRESDAPGPGRGFRLVSK